MAFKTDVNVIFFQPKGYENINAKMKIVIILCLFNFFILLLLGEKV